MLASKTVEFLTAFSPSLDYFAISSGDGRIKIWDCVNGQLQTEFSDISSSNGSIGLRSFIEHNRGHLSLDYTCMTWLPLDRKKKRKLESTLLVLGTGTGDVLALDVSSGQLKWAFTHCHAGGASAVSFSTFDSYVYTSGRDKMVCKIEPQTGQLVQKFKGSSKAISSMAVSPDGRRLAAASAQLKIFNCTDNLKIQKFSGHPVSVRSIALSEDGKHIVSCAFGERYVVLWDVDGTKTRTSKCVFQMESPAISVECKEADCLCILAISEIGVCYVWYGQTVVELQNSKPAKVSLSSQDSEAKYRKGDPMILSAKLLGFLKPSQVKILVSYGSIVKPLFQKIAISPGEHKKLQITQQDVLIPLRRSIKDNKIGGHKVNALDQSNADNAILPTAKVSNLGKVEANESSSSDIEEIAMDEENEGVMEQKLRQMKILESSSGNTFRFANFLEVDGNSNASLKTMRAIVSSLDPEVALKALEELTMMWQSRTCNDRRLLLWIHNILVYHGGFISSNCPSLDSLQRMTMFRRKYTQMLLQLSGRLQLFNAQIDKAGMSKEDVAMQDVKDDNNDDISEAEDEELNEEINEEEEESELSSDDVE